MLAGCCVRYLFGNPGTTELPLCDAMVDERRACEETGTGSVAVGDDSSARQSGKVPVPVSSQPRRVQYILALQEVPAMAMADGDAQASRAVGVVNLHICCGLGTGMGMLYNAYREGTPLVVTAGQQDQRLAFEEPILWGRMVDVVRPWTKWAHEVRRVEDLPSAVRRAVQMALTPPCGPVFLSLPLDVQMAAAEKLDLTPPRLPAVLVRAPLDALR